MEGLCLASPKSLMTIDGLLSGCRKTGLTLSLSAQKIGKTIFFTLHILNEELLTHKENSDASVDVRSKPLKMPNNLNCFSF